MSKLITTCLFCFVVFSAAGQRKVLQGDDLYHTPVRSVVQADIKQVNSEQFNRKVQAGGGMIAVGGIMAAGALVYNLVSAEQKNYNHQLATGVQLFGFAAITIGGLTIATAHKNQ